MAPSWMAWALAGAALAGARPDSVSSVCLLQRTKPGVLQESLLAGRAARNLSEAPASPVPPNDDSTRPLRLELTILASLSEIHTGPLGPLPSFVRSVREELCTSAGVPAERLTVLSVRGAFMTLDAAFLQEANATALGLALLSESQGAHDAGHAAKSDPSITSMVPGESTGGAAAEAAAQPLEKVVVDIEVLPGHLMSDPTPWMLFRLLLGQLKDGSRLMTGPLGDLLHEATLIQGALPMRSGPQSSANAKASISGRSLAALLLAAWVADALSSALH